MDYQFVLEVTIHKKYLIKNQRALFEQELILFDMNDSFLKMYKNDKNCLY